MSAQMLIMHFFTGEGDRRSTPSRRGAVDARRQLTGEVPDSGIASSLWLRRRRAARLLTSGPVGQGHWSLVWPLLDPRLRHHASHRSPGVPWPRSVVQHSVSHEIGGRNTLLGGQSPPNSICRLASASRGGLSPV